jgi:hypothetical protein
MRVFPRRMPRFSDGAGGRAPRAAPGHWPSCRSPPARPRPGRPFPAGPRRGPAHPRRRRTPRISEPACGAACGGRPAMRRDDEPERSHPAYASARRAVAWPWPVAAWPWPVPVPAWPWPMACCSPALSLWPFASLSPASLTAPETLPRKRLTSGALPGKRPRASAWRCGGGVAYGGGCRELRPEVCRSSPDMIAHLKNFDRNFETDALVLCIESQTSHPRDVKSGKRAVARLGS